MKNNIEHRLISSTRKKASNEWVNRFGKLHLKDSNSLSISVSPDSLETALSYFNIFLFKVEACGFKVRMQSLNSYQQILSTVIHIDGETIGIYLHEVGFRQPAQAGKLRWEIINYTDRRILRKCRMEKEPDIDSFIQILIKAVPAVREKRIRNEIEENQRLKQLEIDRIADELEKAEQKKQETFEQDAYAFHKFQKSKKFLEEIEFQIKNEIDSKKRASLIEYLLWARSYVESMNPLLD